jgi:hypothetical protein
MSAAISPSLPRSDPSSDELTAFDGAEDLSRAWHDGLKPDPDLTVSEWANRHRVLSPRASGEPGRYRTDRTPYLRAIMDTLSPAHPARRVVFIKAGQVGETECGNNWIGSGAAGLDTVYGGDGADWLASGADAEVFLSFHIRSRHLDIHDGYDVGLQPHIEGDLIDLAVSTPVRSLAATKPSRSSAKPAPSLRPGQFGYQFDWLSGSLFHLDEYGW